MLPHDSDGLSNGVGGAFTSLPCASHDLICTPSPQKPIEAHIDTLQHDLLARTRKKARLMAIAGDQDSASFVGNRGKHIVAVREQGKPSLVALDDDIANRVFILATPDEIETDEMPSLCAGAQNLLSPKASVLGESFSFVGDCNWRSNRAGTATLKAHRPVPLKEGKGSAGHEEETRQQGHPGESSSHRPLALANFFRPIESRGRGFPFGYDSEGQSIPSRVTSQAYATDRNSRIFRLAPRSMKIYEESQWSVHLDGNLIR
jgi:hypothetical protein